MPFITRLNCHRRGVGERPEEENGRETLVHPTRPAKGDEKLLEISTRRATFPSPSLPLIFFPALHLINLASRSLCIGDFLRRGERGKKKHFKQGAPKWHRADKLRYRLDEAPTARVPIYIYIYIQLVETLICGPFQLSIRLYIIASFLLAVEDSSISNLD